MSKSALIEAMRRKRFSKDEDVQNPMGDQELAPPGGSANEAHEGPETRDSENQNVNESGSAVKLPSKAEFPHQSVENNELAITPLHKPKDANVNRMISGTGATSQSGDDVGVDDRQRIREQGSERTIENRDHGKEMKQKVAADVNAAQKTSINPKKMDSDNTPSEEPQMAKGRFMVPGNKAVLEGNASSDDSNETGLSPEPTRPLKGLAKAGAMIDKKYKR